MSKLSNIARWLLPILFFASCAKEQEGSEPSHQQVLLVYLAADNNLADEAQEKLDALCSAWNGDTRKRIIIYKDLASSGAELLEVNSSGTTGNRLLLIENYGKENSASAGVFARVIRDVQDRYPADDYGLLVFSHATGWLPQGAMANPYNRTRSITANDSDEMELSDFAAAIPDGMFSRIIFETCFMAGIEVAYELRNKTLWILASSAEIVSPGFTPVYATALDQLFAKIPQAFGESAFRHISTYADYRNSGTYSLIRTSELEALAGFVRENCETDRAVAITEIQRFDRNRNNTLFFDFEEYYTRLLRPGADKAELSRLIKACVPWKAATDGFMNQSSGLGGFAIEHHCGLTAYIPQDRLRHLNDCYKEIQWSMRTAAQ